MDGKLSLPAGRPARRSKARTDDFDAAKAHADGAVSAAALPDSVDLRRPWHTVPDQGKTASCVGWAVADSVLRWHLVEAGQLEPTEPLSARHVWMAAMERSVETRDLQHLRLPLQDRFYGRQIVWLMQWSERYETSEPVDH